MKKAIVLNIIFLILCVIIGIGTSIMNGNIKPLGEALVWFGGFSLAGWVMAGGFMLFCGE